MRLQGCEHHIKIILYNNLYGTPSSQVRESQRERERDIKLEREGEIKGEREIARERE